MHGYTLESLLSFGIFLLEILLIVRTVIRAFSFRHGVDEYGADEADLDPKDAAINLAQVVSSRLLYERAYEVNRDVNSEIQGVENGLLGILAAVAAVVVLAIDKLADLGLVALGCLAIAFIACAVGYLRGRAFAVWSRQSEDPRRFFHDLILDPNEAHQEGAEDLIEALVATRALLIGKRRWAMAAIVALIVGTLVGGLVKVVHSKSDGPAKADAKRQEIDRPKCQKNGSGKVAPPVCRITSQAIWLDAPS